MIHIDRNSITKPEVFASREIEISNKRLQDFFSKQNRSQQNYSLPFQPELRKQFISDLRVLFKGKCAYCESIIPLETSRSEYDHFRPKSGARGFDKEFSKDYYWWLTYEWNNLYYSCSACNQYKSSWFPIEGDRAPLGTLYHEIIELETPLLVDPCVDDPELHLSFNETGEVDYLTAKGKSTIEIIKLNRSELVEARKKVIQMLKEDWDTFNELFSNQDKNMERINEISQSWKDILRNQSSRPYLAAQKSVLTSLLKDAGISDYLSNRDFKVFQTSEIIKGEALKFSIEEIEKLSDKVELSFEDKDIIDQSIDFDQVKHIYVEKIELYNFKCFKNLELKFNQSLESANGKEPWLLFLGENGVGKSSILKAFVIGLTGKEYINDLGLKGKELLKHGETDGYIKIHLVGAKQPIIVTFDDQKIETTLFQPIVNIAAYNSIRLKPQIGKMVPEKIEFYGAKAKNLFDYTFSLVDADNWLSTLQKEIFDRAALTLKDLMLLDPEDTIEIENYQAVVNKGGDKFFIEELSDGYKSVFYLAVDIMATLVDENVTFNLAEGMVLIDEIGTHLHPRWRMEVVGRLRKAFPKIRFVVTTHEPLCLRGLHANETTVLTKNEKKEIIALTDLPNPNELRIDQILTSDFFGLKSTIEPETERLFDEYYKILALDEKNRTESEKNRLLELSQSLPRIKHIGDTEREDIAYFVIDELLARKTREDGLKIKEDIKAEALKRVESIWNFMSNK